MEISVVIPTYNRSEVLRQCLELLEKQEFDGEFEVIVVDDGSTDGTAQVVKSFARNANFDLHYIFQENQGQGIARNKGIGMAKGEIIVFIGDDILVGKDFLGWHWRTHQECPQVNVGVLGFVDWHPSLNLNFFMRWLTDGSSVLGRFGGHQFAFEKLKNREWADYNFFYTSNISLKRELLLQAEFDADFKNYGWEDIELGYRLTKDFGFRLRYQPKAVGWHLHKMDESSLRERMMMIGRSAWILHRKYPELGKVPAFSKRFAFFILGNWVSILFLRLLSFFSERAKGFYYYALSKRYFLKGLRQK